MKIIKTIAEVQSRLDGLTNIGFVPTMGFLHEGHLSLVKQSLKETDHTIVSIYVNQAQFGPNEDFDSYPRNYEKDLTLLKDLGVQSVFMPSPKEIYDEDPDHATKIIVPELSSQYCGVTRPQFFIGICMVVCRLLNIIKPKKAFFGLKDYQQYVIIKKMVKDLFIETDIIGCPLVREKDGLALSSRNAYLSESEHKEASHIYQMLLLGKKEVQKGQTKSENVVKNMLTYLSQNTAIQADYLAIVDPESLKDQSSITKNDYILFAGNLGKTRLIDNLQL